VKWHTLDDFWNELKTAIVESGCTVIQEMSPDSITHIAHYQYNKKEEKGKIIFENEKGLLAFIGHVHNDYIFWGIDKKNLSDIYNIKMQGLKDQQKIHDNPISWWNYFQFEDGDKLFIKDFSSDKTFNLINPTLRKETINQIVKQLFDFISTHLEVCDSMNGSAR